mmetsp:Transcript_6228/g.7652  ORF Transcript_6228/g.7652 Transcript_6228/m.7652 type:complete len:155 (-) Transcript_6228:35-499(-)
MRVLVANIAQCSSPTNSRRAWVNILNTFRNSNKLAYKQSFDCQSIVSDIFDRIKEREGPTSIVPRERLNKMRAFQEQLKSHQLKRRKEAELELTGSIPGQNGELLLSPRMIILLLASTVGYAWVQQFSSNGPLVPTINICFSLGCIAVSFRISR